MPAATTPPTPPADERSTRVAIVAAVVALALLAMWDQQREARAALADFADDQVVVARSLADQLGDRLGELQRATQRFAERDDIAVLPDHLALGIARRPAREAPRVPADGHVRLSVDDGHEAVDVDVPVAWLVEEVTAFARPGQEAIVVLRPGDDHFETGDGRRLADAPLVAALLRGDTTAMLSREQATALGLPARVAVVGLAGVDVGDLGRFGVGYVVTAERLRDRETRSRVRLLLGFLATAGLVMAFGAVAQRRQRRALALAHELAVADVESLHERRLESANRAATLGTLAMGIAHELATPASVIRGRAEQLRNKVDDERQRAALTAIVNQADGITDVVRGFLRLARGDAPATTRVAVPMLVRGAFDLVEHRFQRADITLSSSLLSSSTDAPSMPPVVGDARLLEHALVNLLLNACDACEAGGSVVVGVARVVDGDHDAVEIVVADDGRGISVDDVAQVTAPFFTTKDVDHGTGLGLAITTEIVRAHRGRLVLAPRSPRGTIATLVLPTASGSTP